jgi:ParB-like chromosome segregation protein Spo0J
MEELSVVQSVMLKMSDIQPNRGQIEGLKKNPRLIKDDKYRKLVASIQEHPEFTAMRELLVYPFDGKYVIIGGNMRYKAMKELGIKSVPCKVIPEETSVEQLEAYTLKDNSGYGEWDFDLLKDWDLQLIEDCAIEIPEIQDIVEEMPMDLDGEDKNEPFSVKITFIDEDGAKKFIQEYEEEIKSKCKCRMVYRGGEV